MAATAYLLDAARRMTCAALDDGHHPAVVTAIMKAQATDRMRVVGQRRDGRARRQGHHRRAAQLSRQPLSRRADRHHGRRRQHRHPQPDPIRPGRDPLPSLSAEGNDGAGGRRPRRAASTHSTRSSGRMSATASPMRCAPGAVRGPAACWRRRRTPARRRGFTASSAVTLRRSRLPSISRCSRSAAALKRKEMMSARFGDILSELYLSSRRAQALE